MTTELSPFALSLQRAMPVTRLLDCGMDHADAMALHTRTSAGEPWDVAAEALADAQLARAAQAAEAGHRVTAADAQAMAIANLLFAQMAFNHDVPRKRALYARLVDASHGLARWSDKRIERVEVPFGDAHPDRLAGPAADRSRTRHRRPVRRPERLGLRVLADRARTRGARRPRCSLKARARRSSNSGSSSTSTCAPRTGVSSMRSPTACPPIGIWGNSIGGLWAAATAASDQRIAACCVNGALAAPTLLPFRTFVEQAAAMLGNDDPDAVTANFARMRFSSERDRIACPLLVLHGGDDPLIRLDDQQPFLDAATSGDATLRVWPDGEHTIYNHASERTAFVCDWFVERFARAAAA